MNRTQKKYLRSYLRIEGDQRRISAAQRALWNHEDIDLEGLDSLLGAAAVKLREKINTHPLTEFLNAQVKEK